MFTNNFNFEDVLEVLINGSIEAGKLEIVKQLLGKDQLERYIQRNYDENSTLQNNSQIGKLIGTGIYDLLEQHTSDKNGYYLE